MKKAVLHNLLVFNRVRSITWFLGSMLSSVSRSKNLDTDISTFCNEASNVVIIHL